MAEQKSSYLRYLPPVLWEKEPPLPTFSLGAMLRIFEKILSGIDDSQVITHNGHAHDPIEATIARLHRLYDPWATPEPFLNWLASWLSLAFPKIWDEYQKRKVTSQIVQIYRRRGLKDGLNEYLDLYTVAATRPRIAIDDCSRILFAKPEPQRLTRMRTLLSQGPSLTPEMTTTAPLLPTGNQLLQFEGILAPTCMARAADGTLLVGDMGTPVGFAPVLEQRVWKIDPAGAYDFDGGPRKPKPTGQAAWNLVFPVALAVDGNKPWKLYVLDNVIAGAVTALYELTSPALAVATPRATKQELSTNWPVSMAFDINGHLLILDRGAPAPAAGPSNPKIIDVDLGPTPVVVMSRKLNAVLEPLSLSVLSSGDLIIGDGREQNLSVPADLVYVDRANPAAWVETRLLGGLPLTKNPLAQPTAVVAQDDAHLFVLDIGLKPYLPNFDPVTALDPYRRRIANPAAIYRVDLSGAVPLVERATENGQFVFPTDMALGGDGTLYVCDRGEMSDPALAGPVMRVWRATYQEFGVVIHFSEERPTTQQQRRQIVENIRSIIDTEGPAHAAWAMVYSV